MINLILSGREAVAALGFMAAMAGGLQAAAEEPYSSARACLKDASEIEKRIASETEPVAEELSRAIEIAKDYCIQTRYQRANELLEETRDKLGS